MSRWPWISWAVALCMMSARVACAAETPPAADHLASAGMVAQLALDGPIGPAAAEYFDDASKHAVADGAVAIVLRLDTPGGLSDSMRQIITGMLACKVPVLVYVAPGGARAASAGTYILYAGQIAAMAPATHVGAATPVSLGGGTPMPFPKTSVMALPCWMLVPGLIVSPLYCWSNTELRAKSGLKRVSPSLSPY